MLLTSRPTDHTQKGCRLQCRYFSGMYCRQVTCMRYFYDRYKMRKHSAPQSAALRTHSRLDMHGVSELELEAT
jgi:hypothetical protein